MDQKDKYLIIAAVIICIVISCLSPFIASGDPDGLEKSAEDTNVSDDKESPVLESPFPDYLGESSQVSQIVVLILGGLLTLICGYGIAEILKKRS